MKDGAPVDVHSSVMHGPLPLLGPGGVCLSHDIRKRSTQVGERFR